MKGFIFKPSFIFKAIPLILGYLPITLYISLLSVFFGLALGAALAKGKLSKHALARLFSNGYTTVMRCTPSVVLLFTVFYGLPMVFRSLESLPRVFFAVTALTLLYAASASELMRSAYESIDKGQREAAVSIGLSEWQAFYRVVLPQCLKIIIPNLSLSVVALMKEASLGFTIGVVDMMGKARLIISDNYNAFSLETYLSLALIYWAMSFIIQGASEARERLIQKKEEGGAAL